MRGDESTRERFRAQERFAARDRRHDATVRSSRRKITHAPVSRFSGIVPQVQKNAIEKSTKPALNCAPLGAEVQVGSIVLRARSKPCLRGKWIRKPACGQNAAHGALEPHPSGLAASLPDGAEEGMRRGARNFSALQVLLRGVHNRLQMGSWRFE